MNKRFSTFAWGVLGFNVLVIIWGAFVRATGSGAGCGSHWPLCNGELVPRAPQVETLIEFSHRITSGIALLGVVALLIWAMRSFPRGHHVRKAAGASMFFMVTEALVGAGLVPFEYVAHNVSIARAYWMAGHLTNTFLLLAALTLALLVVVIHQGLMLGHRGAVWLGYVGFSAEIFALYVKTVGSLAGSSLFFLVAGVIVIALAAMAWWLHQAESRHAAETLS